MNHLTICITCRRPGDASTEVREGQRLFDAVCAERQRRGDSDDLQVAAVECMSGCSHACTAAFSANGKTSYLFGDLDASAETAAQAIDLLVRFGASPEGTLPWAERPEAFRRALLAKLPAPVPAARPPDFDEAFRVQLTDLLHWRRDVRHFRKDPLPVGAIERLLRVAELAPSVGLSQPWRFVLVEDAIRRGQIRDNFLRCNQQALADFSGDRAELYARLKLAGLDEAPCQIAVFADHGGGQGHGLGRKTMPETLDYSVAMAVHTLWLAARAENIGLGWVSILDPDEVASTLAVPASWRLVAYLCVGYAESAEERPELERLGWERRRQT